MFLPTKKFLAFGLFAFLVACDGQVESGPVATLGETEKPAGEVNLYSARHYDTDLALYTDFTEATGIKVNLIEADSDSLIERIVNEGDLSPADLLITVDAGRLWRAEQREIFQSVQSAVLEERIPAHLRHPDGLWFGISKRARVVIYNKEDGAPQGLRDYLDLADPAYAGKVCIRSSSNIYNISLMASIVSNYGEAAAENWARGVVRNFARDPQGNDTAQIKAVASGECGLALANTYYVARLIASDNPADNEVANAIGVIFPGQAGRGTHVNISGVGVVKNAPNRENAIQFLEYLTEQQAQSYFSEGNNEYPVVTGAPTPSAAASLGSFKEDTLNAGELGVHQATAVKVFDRAGWQ